VVSVPHPLIAEIGLRETTNYHSPLAVARNLRGNRQVESNRWDSHQRVQWS